MNESTKAGTVASALGPHMVTIKALCRNPKIAQADPASDEDTIALSICIKTSPADRCTGSTTQ